MAGTNGQGGQRQREDSLGNDSSTAMSLDESSIALNNTSAASLSVDIMSGLGEKSIDQQSVLNGDNKAVTSSKDLAINGGGVLSAAAIGRKKPLNINLPPNYNHNNDDDNISSAKTPQRLASASSATQQKGCWNNVNYWNIQSARTQLRNASRECNRRGLKLASRWASEQLMGLAQIIVAPSQTESNMMMDDNDQENNQLLQPLPEENCQPNDMEIYAMSLFDLGEYSRAAHVLSLPPSSSHNTPTSPSPDGSLGQINPPQKDLTPLGIYLRAYSLYLEGERRKEEQVTELRDPLERTALYNTNLSRLEAELKRAHTLGNLDAFGLYVYGVVLKELRGGTGTKCAQSTSSNENEQVVSASQKGDTTAHRILVSSILAYPFNWSAWLDLGELCVNDQSIDAEVEELLSPIAEHWMYHFFCVHVFIENKANENAIAIIEKLANGNEYDNDDAAATLNEEDGNYDDNVAAGLATSSSSSSGFFVQSAYLQSQLAMAYYDVRDYDSAHEHFLALTEREPYRLDHMDAFSNVLYVKDQKVALSHLAHRSVTVDKYRPETCIIVGNYYSSKGRHEKAVQYFQRALKLDRNYLSAWTLLGHEYIEMKNTAAAIEAYRRAVDISDREYRAWYGLGQTYEIMNMLLHALFYFRKAAALHPHDARMWCAIGGCLLGLDRRADAEKSYERAVSLGDGEGIATRKLAELYREDGDEEKAAKCYLRHLELRYQSQLPGSFSGASADTSPEAFEAVVTSVRVDEPEAEALLYLAYYYRDNLEYNQAILCATRLEDYPGPEKEQGKGLLRDIRSRMDQKAGERKKNKGGAKEAATLSSTSPTTPAMALRSGRNLSMDSKSSKNVESSFEFSP